MPHCRTVHECLEASTIFFREFARHFGSGRIGNIAREAACITAGPTNCVDRLPVTLRIAVKAHDTPTTLSE
jgi:hypothetical protein